MRRRRRKNALEEYSNRKNAKKKQEIREMSEQNSCTNGEWRECIDWEGKEGVSITEGCLYPLQNYENAKETGKAGREKRAQAKAETLLNEQIEFR